MKKTTKTKAKASLKEGGNAPRGQVVKIRQGKAKPGLASKLPPVKQYWITSKNFVVEAVQELKKTTWPNRKETLTTTAVCLVLVFFVAVYLGFVDFLLSHFLRFFIH
jgi:preprotein translocase subunit SecE